MSAHHTSNNMCTIDLKAIKTNIKTIRAALPTNTEIMAIVKANGYGTDFIQLAEWLVKCGVRKLGVSHIDEGEALRCAGIDQDILLFATSPWEVKRVVDANLEVGVSDFDLIQLLGDEAARANKKALVHLAVDTGMGRFGCRPKDSPSLAQAIEKHPHLQLEGIFSHLSCADTPEEDPFTHQQIDRLNRVISQLQSAEISPPWRHIANSAAMARFSLPQYNMVRVGLSLFGFYTSPAVEEALPLIPALTLTTRVVGIKDLRKGESVSYGRKYQIKEKAQRIAILPIGYHDGLSRCYSGKGCVQIRGEPAPMIGAICMDYMMVDITAISDVQMGDSALIFGRDKTGNMVSPHQLTSSGGTIVHELLACLGPRIQRALIL